MGKLLKIILSLAGVLIALIVVAMIALPLVVDPNDYKDEIVTAVMDKTGRTLEIEGDIALSVFPWLGLDIGPTRFGNAAGFSDPWMASMDAVQVRVRLLPLLKKQLEVSTVKLSGMQLSLAKDNTGKTNWDDLTEAAEPEAEQQEQEGDGEAMALERLAIGGIEISDARLVWDDRQSDARYEIDALNLTTGAIESGEPFDLDLGFSIAASEPEIEGQFELGGGVLIAEAMNALDITDARLSLDASGAGVPGGKLQLSLGTDVAIDLEAQTLSLPALVLEALGMRLTGNVAGNGITGDAAEFNGMLNVAGFAPRELFKALDIEAPDTADAGVLGKADAAISWNASPKHFAVDDLKLHLDETSVTGNARVDSFDAPAIRFTLAVDAIDLDRYLPPAPAEGESTATAEQEAAAPPQLEGLRQLNLNGKLSIAKMKAAGLSYSDVRLDVKARDGVVRMHPIGAQLYSGSYNGDITLDVRKKTPRVSVNEKVSGVQAGPLLKDLIGDDKLRGTANLTAKFTGSGLTPDELRRTVTGNAAFSFTEGAVKGVNIAALIRKAQATLKGQPAPPDDLPNQTDFAVMKGTATVTNGLVRNDDLTLQSPLLRISGNGQTHLAEETIDYLLTTKIVGSLEGQGGRALGELKGLAIPVHVGGTYSKPSYRPDLASVVSEAAKAKVQEKVEEKVQEKLGEELGDKLFKGLFK